MLQIHCQRPNWLSFFLLMDSPNSEFKLSIFRDCISKPLLFQLKRPI